MKSTQPFHSETAIWDRLLQPVGKGLSLQAARGLLRLDFTPADKERMQVLAGKAREGSLTATEQEELHTYERAGNLLALMKSKARQRLKPDRVLLRQVLIDEGVFPPTH